MRIPAALLLLLLLLFPKTRVAAGEGAVTRGDFVVLLWESAGAVPYDAATAFTDVPRDHACAQALGWAAAQSLVLGVGEGRFAPDQTLTVAEALKLAAFLESRYTGDSFHQQPAAGSPWYRSSVAYCEASGILEPGQFDDYQRPITRLEMARLFAATSLGRSMPEINDLERVRQSVPDLDGTEPDAEAAYRLYAQGVLTGSDGALTFRPGAPLTRAEAAAVAARMARAEQRVRLWG